MMKKSIFAALTLAAASPALAQSEQTTQNGDITEKVEYTDDKYKVETNHFWDNWFITVGAGPQMMFGDHDKQVGFGKRISPSLDIAVGKWFTPGLGLRLQYSGLQAKGFTMDPFADYVKGTQRENRCLTGERVCITPSSSTTTYGLM